MPNNRIDSEESKAIPVIMAFDGAFYIPAAVTVVSLLENADPERHFRFTFLTREENNASVRELFFEISLRYSSFSYSFLRLPEDGFENSAVSDRISRMSYARLSIINLFPQLSACIYLDGDLLVLDDIAALWDEIICDPEFQVSYLAAAPDLLIRNSLAQAMPELKEIFSSKDLERYFNVGVLVMNLEKMRHDYMDRKFVSYGETSFPFHDQDILNICCGSRVRPIPFQWNVPTLFFTWAERVPMRGCPVQSLQFVLRRRISILHYLFQPKPWNQICSNTFDHMWFMYAALMPQTDSVKEFLEPMDLPVTLRVDCTKKSLRGSDHIILYGFTHFSRSFLDWCMRQGYPVPDCFCDMSKSKQGREYLGVFCRSWEEVKELVTPDTVIVICAQRSWPDIWDDLRKQGISAGQIIRWVAEQEMLVPCRSVGFLTGIFDCLDYAQLDKIRRAKALCRFLRIGVLSDALINRLDKCEAAAPQEQRLEIVRAIRDVDEVVLVDKGEDSCLSLWRQWPFDCIFTDRITAAETCEQQALDRVGAEILPVQA